MLKYVSSYFRELSNRILEENKAAFFTISDYPPFVPFSFIVI